MLLPLFITVEDVTFSIPFFQKLKAEGMLIVMPRVMHLDDNVTYSIDIPVALIGQSSKEMLMVTISFNNIL